MDQLLIPYKALLDEQERKELKHYLSVAYTYMGLAFGAFFLSVLLFCVSIATATSYIPAMASFICACFMVGYTLRKGSRKNEFESNLLNVAKERFQDEIFLRYGVIPTRSIRLNEEAKFVDVDNAERNGIAFFSKNGTPQFAEAK